MAITVNQIAEQCGVSRTTVLRALNGGSVAKETKKKILQIADAYNYRPNLLARSLNHGRTMSLGVVTINIENMYFVQLLDTINHEADQRGYFTNIVVCDDSLEWEKNLIQGLADRQMEGIILSPIGMGKEYEEYLISLNIPIICIGNKVSDKITTIQVNEMAAAMDSVELIVSKGYEKIVFVCPPYELLGKQNIYTHKQRMAGFKAAISLHPEIESEIIDVMDFMPRVTEMIDKDKEKRVAYLCSGDEYALRIMKWGKQNNKHIPDDFGLMGFDDINVLQYITPELSTVSTNMGGIAKSAVSELIEQIEKEDYLPKTITLNYEILDRETL